MHTSNENKITPSGVLINWLHFVMMRIARQAYIEYLKDPF